MSFLAFEQMAEMWFDQEMSEDRMTPRYLVSVTLFYNISIDGTFGSIGSLFLEKSRWQHFRNR